MTITDILPQPFEWIDIPAGEVALIPNEYAKRKSHLKEDTTFDVLSFAIAKYPITNAQFCVFWEDGGYDNRDCWTDEGWQCRQDKNWTEPRYWQDEEWNKDDYPVVGVSWLEAVAFCLWLDDKIAYDDGTDTIYGVRTSPQIMLPTEQQWQRAAQGDDGRKYPWGNELGENRCNSKSDGTTSVTKYEGKGDSPFGVVDMSGNVWEWCLTDYHSGAQDFNSHANRRVLRGCSWIYISTMWLHVISRGDGFPVGGGSNFRGFRVARSF